MSINLEVRNYKHGGRHAHDYCQILFPLRGSMQVDIEGSRGIVSGNRIAVIPQQHIHDFVPSAGCSLLVMDIEEAALAGEQVPAMLRGRSPSIAPVEPWLWRLFRLLGTEIESDARHAHDASRVAMAGLHLLAPATALPPLPEAKRRILGVAQALDDRTQTRSVTDLARDAGLGQSQFHALFRVAVGQSPKQFQLRKLLDRAMDRLLNTSEPVSEIAYALGYQNVSSFNRLFKRRFGLTPTEFRVRGRSATPH